MKFRILYKYASEKEQDAIRKRGKQAQDRLMQRFLKAAQAVFNKRSKPLPFSPYYRPLEVGRKQAVVMSLLWMGSMEVLLCSRPNCLFSILNWLSIFCVIYVLVMDSSASFRVVHPLIDGWSPNGPGGKQLLAG